MLGTLGILFLYLCRIWDFLLNVYNLNIRKSYQDPPPVCLFFYGTGGFLCFSDLTLNLNKRLEKGIEWLGKWGRAYEKS